MGVFLWDIFVLIMIIGNIKLVVVLVEFIWIYVILKKGKERYLVLSFLLVLILYLVVLVVFGLFGY